jgi:hypothetical protein
MKKLNKPIKLTKTDYESFLGAISTRVYGLNDYGSYVNFQNDWECYYKNVYCKNHDCTKPPRIFLAESAPSGSYTINANYIFKKSLLKNKICDKQDMFLYRYYRGVFPSATPADVKGITKEEALTQLSKDNILILDLLPTHGIKLDTKARNCIKESLLESLDYSFFNGLGFKGLTINYVFSVPPSLYHKNMCKVYLKPNFREFGNINTGQGHAPSIKEIIKIIRAGF